MKNINEFSLEKHQGAYEQWPEKSKLYRNGEDVGQKIPGYDIELQYQLEGGYFFIITSYDCPFEEQCDLILLDKDYKTIALRSLIPWYYTSWNYDGHTYQGNNKFVLTFNENCYMAVTLSPEKWFNRRKIAWKWLKGSGGK